MTQKTNIIENITILGSGAWGTALAQVLATAGRKVMIYARSESVADTINTKKENTRYLPDVTRHSALQATTDLKEACTDAGMILLAVPAQYMRDTLTQALP